MLSKKRFVILGVPQHVIQRAHNREPCFYSEKDYFRYLENLHAKGVNAFIILT